MSAPADFVRPLVAFAPGPPRRWVATRAALAAALPLIAVTLAGYPHEALICGLGVFAVLYGAGGPVKRRFVTIPVAGGGLLLAIAIGGLSAGSDVGGILAVAAVATLASFVTYALGVGPPGAFFFALNVGVANLAVDGGASIATVLSFAAVGVLSAIIVGTSDAWFGAHGIEEAAVSHAEKAVETYVQEEDPQEVMIARRNAASALNRAWTAVTDGTSGELFDGRLQRINNRYAATVARAVGSADEEVTAELALLETSRVRQISLGRPRASWSVRQALRWPTEDLLVAARVAAATLLAGGVALLMNNDRAYWAAAFAVLIVQAGGTRFAQTQRALQRTIGTGLGLLLFIVILRLDLNHWATIALIVALQFAVEMLITRNYVVAVTVLTPLGLTISMSLSPHDPSGVIADRGIDTVIGVVAAVIVIVVSGRLGRPELLLRAHARRVVKALIDVLNDLVDRRSRTPEGMALHIDHCRQLYVELIESDLVARRALADAPQSVGPYREMEQLLAHIGYLVLGATWSPHLRGERERMAQARAGLAKLTHHPVTRQRSAAEITADLRLVQEVLGP